MNPGDDSAGGAAEKARQRRERRERRISGDRLTGTGTPVRSALARVPFVLLIMALMAGGIVAALALTTMTDEAALQTTKSQQQQTELRLKIEAAKRDVLSLGSLPRLQQQAIKLGLIPAGDAAILVVKPGGNPTVVGTPTPAAVPTTPAATTSPAPPSTTSQPPATPGSSTQGTRR